MAIGEVDKGTAQAKTSGTTLTVSSVTLNAGRSVKVFIGWEDNVQGDTPTLKWGKRDLKLIVDSQRTRGDSTCRWYRTRIRNTGTKDLVATWANAVTARAMVLVEVDEASNKDVQQRNDQASSTSLNTGTAVTSTVADTLSLAGFMTLGPAGDAQGTAGAGHTLGQRVGTTGGGAATNITLQVTSELLSATGNVRATLTLTTARASASSIVAFKASQTYTVGRAYYQPWDGSHVHEVVVFVMEDESSTERFQVHISRAEFNEMDDADVDEKIRDGCQWYDSKVRDSAPSPDFTPDAAFDSRVLTFENDTVTI